MKILRTPDDRFANLPGYPFEPNYIEIGAGLRMHYVDEGPRDADPVLMLHGEPSWSYLYRKMIPVIAGAGFRAIAPDLIGFGRSDKPTERSDYSYQSHMDWLHAFLEGLELRRTTFFGQDWGGLLGLRLVAEAPDRFDRVVASNTFLPTGDRDLGEAFHAWRKFSQESPKFPIGFIVKGGCASDVSQDVVDAYDAPFPDDTYKAGGRQFPMLVPSSPDDPAAPANRKAWEVLQTWDKPFLTAFGDSDPITRGAERVLQELIPGAKGQPHATISNAGHFLQEDKGEELAEIVLAFMRDTGARSG
ncbi:MAG: haloalkane dehalogenase [Actinomycetota bacterium]